MKDATKNDRLRTSDEGQRQERTTTETVVADDGPAGMERFRTLLKRVLGVPKEKLQSFLFF